MIGKRVYCFTSLQPGEYGKQDDENWYANSPNDLLANLGNHHVVECEDGTITVTPSIKVWNNSISWHGYLTKGEWQEC